MKLSLRWYSTDYFEDLHTYFLHPLLMSAASISQFDWWLVNQQRQIYDSVFRLFDLSKYLTTLRSNISHCQKATTLILITLYNPSFHLWKSSKNYLGTSVFLFWMPFKICDSDKFLLTTPVTQFLLQAVTWQNKPTFFRSLYKMIDQERLKMLKTFEIFCRNGKFDNLTSSLPANFLWWNPKT